MELNEQRTVMLALLSELDSRKSWCGETHVQKCAFFLKEGLGVPLPFTFVLYKHGPFSFDLREALGALRGVYLIDTKPRERPYGPSLVVSDSGATFLQKSRHTADRYAPQISFVADRLASRSVADLERLGTALYVRQRHPELDADARADKMVSLKPHIKPELAQAAVGEVERLLRDAPALPQSPVLSAVG